MAVKTANILKSLKPKYLMHYQLSDQFKLGAKLGFTLNFVVVLYAIIFRDYPRWMSSMDATFTLLTLLFFAVMLPLMLNGKIKAYYRRDYYSIVYLNIIFIPGIMSAVTRAPLFYAVHYINHRFSRNAMDMVNYPRRLLHMMFDARFSLIALAIFAFYIFILFYQSRFTTIEHFSVRILEIYKKRNRATTFEKCLDEFVMEKLRQKNQKKIVKSSGAPLDRIKRDEPAVQSEVSGQNNTYMKNDDLPIVENKNNVNNSLEDDRHESEVTIRRKQRVIESVSEETPIRRQARK